MAKEVGKEKDAAGVDVIKHSGQAAAAESSIKEMKQKLNEARSRVSRAQDELDSILDLPPLREPTYFEDLHMAQTLAPTTSAPKTSKHETYPRSNIHSLSLNDGKQNPH
jgi:hypothetical protein